MTKILLVEDDKAIVANLTEFLNNEGYIVKSVSGQTAAMKLLAEEKVDLVLLDVSLAEGNGFAACKAIKAEYDMETAQQNLGVLQTLKVHIGMALENEPTEDNSMELQIRIAEIDAEFKAMLSKISTETVDAFDEEKAKRLMDEKVALQQQLADIQDGQLKREQTQTRLDDIYTILDGLKNRPMEYDEQIVRQLLECITVDSKEQITVIFVGGLKVVQPLID